MLRKAGILFAALAMFSIAGGHWAVLQTVAWTEMLLDYTRVSGSVATALVQTFDGEHPCALCQEIAVAKGREKSRPVPSSLADAQKVKAAPGDGKCVTLERELQPRPAVCAVRWFATAVATVSQRVDEPPVPPPRPRLV